MFLPETIPELFESELILFILMSDSLSYKERKKKHVLTRYYAGIFEFEFFFVYILMSDLLFYF
jgi:hypothetical protein